MQTMNIAVAVPVPETITLIVLGDVFHSMLAGPAADVTLTVLRQAVAQLEAQLAPPADPSPAAAPVTSDPVFSNEPTT